jgi:hypothetical protein
MDIVNVKTTKYPPGIINPCLTAKVLLRGLLNTS